MAAPGAVEFGGGVHMAYRVIFWRPKTGVSVLLPPTQPLGEAIRAEVFGNGHSELLEAFPSQAMFARLRTEFAGSRVDEKGYLHWSDDLDNGLVVRCGDQFVELCSFDLSDVDLERVFAVADDFPCEHYDWGN
jgi:hypothetical protein